MKKVLLMAAMILILSGCAGNAEIAAVENTTEKTTEAVSTAGSEPSDQVLALSELLGCSEKTAKSLCDKIEEITEKKIAGIELVQEGPVRFLKITAQDNSEYYVELSKGYFIANVFEDSIDGERIYNAIE